MRFAKIAVVVLLASLALTTCGRSSPTAQSPTTTVPTTTAAPCRLEGATTEPARGAAALTPGAPAALLRNVQVQASDCTDVVSFLFFDGLPSFEVAYGDGPFTADPSGRAVAVAGAAHLRVRLSPATGVDLTAPEPSPTYTGPTAITPGAPSEVAEVRELGDFESVTTWVIGLDARRPFLVTEHEGQLVIRIEARAQRAGACTAEGVTVRPPAGWFAELVDPWTCGMFDPQPFVIQPQTDSITWSITVRTEAVSFTESLARWTAGDTERVIASTATRVDGRPARLFEVEETVDGLYPAGYRVYAYVVDRGADGTLTISATPDVVGDAFTALKRDVDRLVSTTTIAAAPAPTIRCSASGLSADLPADTGLPPAVAAMRADLATAAVACDYRALGALVDRNGAGIRYTFGEWNDPTTDWQAREESGQGVLPLRAMRLLLGLPHAETDGGNGHVVYVWPAAFAVEHPTEAQLQEIAASGLYSMATLRSWVASGMNYLGYRIFITDTGDWTLFVDGD